MGWGRTGPSLTTNGPVTNGPVTGTDTAVVMWERGGGRVQRGLDLSRAINTSTGRFKLRVAQMRLSTELGDAPIQYPRSSPL